MKLVFLFILFSLNSQADDEENHLPLWEYGVGVGYVRYEHYPASNQYSHFLLPFPTFQYRGEILRADDREGAKAYLFKTSHWRLNMGGGILPSVHSDDNEARKGMEDLAWGVQLGPELIYRSSSLFRITLGMYQAVSTDLRLTRSVGILSELQFKWNLEDFYEDSLLEKTQIKDRVEFTVTVEGASREFLGNYFDVASKDVTEQRSFYHAKAGLLSYNLSFFHVFNYIRHSFYLGIISANYDISANRSSPLHKSDYNVTYFVGLTYKLGESLRESTPEEQSRGLLNPQ